MKNLHFLILTLSVLAFCQGCGKNSGGTASDTAPKKLRLAFVTNGKSDFWSIVEHGADSAAQKLGNVDLVFRHPANPTVEGQQEILSDLVASGVDGIAISPIDGEKQAVFLNQIAAKTLLVCIDSDAVDSKRVCFIGTDNVASGKQAADLLKAALPQGGKIVLFVGYTNAQNAKDRIQGIQEELAGSNIQIIDTLTDAVKGDIAKKNALDSLTKYPDLAGMVGLYSYNGPAILAAARAAGKAGQIKIVCFDDDSDTLDGVAVGDIYGTVVQIPTRFGYEAAFRMDKYLCGDKTQLSQGKILLKSLPVNNKARVDDIEAWRQNALSP